MPAREIGPQERSGSVVPLLALLEAEQARWFLWVPVLVGLGVGLYFSLSFEPHLLSVLSGLAAALALRIAVPRRTELLLATNVIVAIALGFALAKVRVEWVRAPVLAKQMRSVEVRGFVELIEPRAKRGERLTLRVTKLGDLGEDARPVRVRVTTGKAAPWNLQAGDPVRVRATLHAARGASAARRLRRCPRAWFDQLGAVGYTWTAPMRDPCPRAPPSASDPVGRMSSVCATPSAGASPRPCPERRARSPTR